MPGPPESSARQDLQRERWVRLRERVAQWARRLPSEASDEALRQQMDAVSIDAPDSARQLSLHLVDYLWAHQKRVLDRHGTRAHYPGEPSIYGATNDALEGVTRLLPVWAAASRCGQATAERIEAWRAHARQVIAHGCDRAHPGYWGDIDHFDPRICEAADVALALWIDRDGLWEPLTTAQRNAVSAWLAQVPGRRTVDNNWHLFVALVDAVRAALDPSQPFSSADRLARALSFARPDGCFIDGPRGSIDLYNAWGFHYALFWIGEIRPELRGQTDPALDAFCRWYALLFTSRGVVLWGRSLCYRLAVAAPLLAAALHALPSTPVSTALSAYVTSTLCFTRAGAWAHGRPTQGVLEQDARWLDAYSGPASSLWGTRALVLHLVGLQRHAAFAGPASGPLPAEREPIDLRIDGLHARLSGGGGQPVVLQFDADSPAARPTGPIQRTWKDPLRELLRAQASRHPAAVTPAGPWSCSSDLGAFL